MTGKCDDKKHEMQADAPNTNLCDSSDQSPLHSLEQLLLCNTLLHGVHVQRQDFPRWTCSSTQNWSGVYRFIKTATPGRLRSQYYSHLFSQKKSLKVLQYV